jgi:hypothetical protein
MAKNIWTGTDGAPVDSFRIDTDRRDLNVADRILELQPSETPFLVIGDKTSSGTAKSLEETWYDDDLAPWWTEAGSDGLAGDTTITVNDGSIVKPKDLIKNTTTGEVMFVTDVSGNDLTVERAYGDETDSGGTAAAAITTGDNFMRMGNAMEENSLAPEARATQPNKFYNYVQVFRTPFSGSLEDINEPKETTEDERTRLRRRKAIEHKLDLERAYVFGERNEHISDKRRTLGGLFQFLTNQYDTIGGNLTESLFEETLEDAFKYGSKEKILITSPRVGSVINKFAKDNVQTRSGETYYGLRIAEYISFHGTLYVATSHMFERDYQGMGAILDMENIDIMPYGGYSTTLRENLQETDRLGWKDEYLTMATLRVRLNKTHRVMDGITFA